MIYYILRKLTIFGLILYRPTTGMYSFNDVLILAFLLFWKRIKMFYEENINRCDMHTNKDEQDF